MEDWRELKGQLSLAWRGFVGAGWPVKTHRRLRQAHRCAKGCQMWEARGLRLPLFICRESGHWHLCTPTACRHRVQHREAHHHVPSARVCVLTGFTQRELVTPSYQRSYRYTSEAAPAPEDEAEVVPRFGSLEARWQERILTALAELWKTLPEERRETTRKHCTARLVTDVERFLRLLQSVPEGTRVLVGPLTWVVALRTREGLELPCQGRTYVLLDPLPELDLPDLRREVYPFVHAVTQAQKQVFKQLARVPEESLRQLALRVR